MSIFKFCKPLTCLLGSVFFATNFAFGMDRNHSFSKLNFSVVETVELPIKEMIPLGGNPLRIHYYHKYGRKTDNIKILHIPSGVREKSPRHRKIRHICTTCLNPYEKDGGFINTSINPNGVLSVCSKECAIELIRRLHEKKGESEIIYLYDQPCYVCLENSLESGFAVYPCGHCTCPNCYCALEPKYQEQCQLCKAPNNKTKRVIFYISEEYVKNQIK